MTSELVSCVSEYKVMSNDVSLSCHLLVILAQLAELFIYAGHTLSVCLDSVCVCACVWMLARVAPIVTAAHRDV